MATWIHKSNANPISPIEFVWFINHIMPKLLPNRSTVIYWLYWVDILLWNAISSSVIFGTSSFWIHFISSYYDWELIGLCKNFHMFPSELRFYYQSIQTHDFWKFILNYRNLVKINGVIGLFLWQQSLQEKYEKNIMSYISQTRKSQTLQYCEFLWKISLFSWWGIK